MNTWIQWNTVIERVMASYLLFSASLNPRFFSSWLPPDLAMPHQLHPPLTRDKYRLSVHKGVLSNIYDIGKVVKTT